MKRTVIDANVIVAEMKAESLRLAIRRERALNRPRTHVFSEGAGPLCVALRDAGVHGDTMGDELAANAADFASRQKAQAAAEAAA